MFTFACCLVVGFGLGLGLGIRFSVWLVSWYSHAIVRATWGCNCHGPGWSHSSDENAIPRCWPNTAVSLFTNSRYVNLAKNTGDSVKYYAHHNDLNRTPKATPKVACVAG